MQEFSSVTASSYDADSLTPLLDQKSAEGWDVVSIVSAGTNIVAYLSRESDGSTVAAAPAVDETPAAPAVEDAPADTPTADAGATPFVPGAAAGAAVAEAPADTTPDPVEEPAGWGSAPQETADDSVASLAAEVGAGEEAATTEQAVTEPAAAEPAAAEPAAAEPAAAEPAAAEPAAAESAVPAGWYADPSGRFELRYWDGGAWTEHVSRAGQQFTDPPVA